jgi:hypothetical protein
MNLSSHDFQKDVRLIGQIPIVTKLLDVIAKTTRMRFVAIARVTQDRWITCSALDNLGFGLVPGAELEIKTTICNEIRDSKRAVIIDCVATDPNFCEHHTPKMYGGFKVTSPSLFFVKTAVFFGTLCAIDPQSKPLEHPCCCWDV